MSESMSTETTTAVNEALETGEVALKTVNENTAEASLNEAQAPTDQELKKAKAAGPIREDDLWETLQRVIDPELHMNIVGIGLNLQS